MFLGIKNNLAVILNLAFDYMDAVGNVVNLYIGDANGIAAGSIVTIDLAGHNFSILSGVAVAADYSAIDSNTLSFFTKNNVDDPWVEVIGTNYMIAGKNMSVVFPFAIGEPPILLTANVDTANADKGTTLTVSATSGVLSNDTVAAGKTLTVTGVIAGNKLDVAGVGSANVGTAIVGLYGTLTLNADGSYTYVANQAACNTIPLNSSAAEAFSYVVSDGTDSAVTQLFVTVINTIPMSGSDLHALLLTQQQAEAAAIVTFVNSAIDGKISIANTNIADLSSKIDAVDTLLSTGGNASAYQAWQDSLNRLGSLEATTAAEQAAINGLLASSTSLQSAITTLQNQMSTFVTHDEAAQNAVADTSIFIFNLFNGNPPHGLSLGNGQAT